MKQPTVFDYPLVIKRVQNFISISVPDLNITQIATLPHDFSEPAALALGKSIIKAWVKSNQEIKRKTLNPSGPHYPTPSRIRKSILSPQDDAKEYLSVPEVAKLLKCSQETVRRLADKNILKCQKTRGKTGHRRFSEAHIQEFMNSMNTAAALDIANAAAKGHIGTANGSDTAYDPSLRNSGYKSRHMPKNRSTLTTSQMAQLLNVSPSQIRRMVEDKILTCRRSKGGHRRFAKLLGSMDEV